MSDNPEPEQFDITSWERLQANDESKEETIVSNPNNNQKPIKAEWDVRTSHSTQNFFENQ